MRVEAIDGIEKQMGEQAFVLEPMMGSQGMGRSSEQVGQRESMSFEPDGVGRYGYGEAVLCFSGLGRCGVLKRYAVAVSVAFNLLFGERYRANQLPIRGVLTVCQGIMVVVVLEMMSGASCCRALSFS